MARPPEPPKRCVILSKDPAASDSHLLKSGRSRGLGVGPPLACFLLVDSLAPASTPHPRLAILGGGISGLASAFWLSERLPQADITVLEASERFGGLIGTLREKEYLLETGPLAFPTGAPATGGLLRRAGLASRCLPSRSTGGIGLWDGRRIRPSPKTAWDVLRGGLLSPLSLARLLCEPFIPRTPEGRDVSIREFFRRRTGEEFFACLLEPLAAGILAFSSIRLRRG